MKWPRTSTEPVTPAAPTLNGRVVGKAIKTATRSLLEEAGFTDFTDRKAWRDSEYTVDHVTFRSFNAYTAGVMGCTSYSFSIEVGVYYRCFDLTLTRPQDYDLTFRSILVKTIRQPFFRTEWGPARDEPTMFHVLPDGSNLAALLADAITQLDRVGLRSWPITVNRLRRSTRW